MWGNEAWRQKAIRIVALMLTDPDLVAMRHDDIGGA
jgi:hypothetical protein